MALTISRLFNKTSAAFAAPITLALVVSACSDDQTVSPLAGLDGSSDTGGAPGSGGKGTGGKGTGGKGTGGGTVSSGGRGGAAGSAGSGGAAGGGAGGAAGAGAGGKGTGGTTTDGGGGADASDSGNPGTGGADTGVPCVPQLPLTKPTVTSAIAVPTAATVAQHFHATGTQNYKCTATTLGDGAVTYAWSAATPEATLFDGCGVEKGTHFAGPTWKSGADQSEVVGGQKLAEAHGGTIPWLRLSGISHTGTGIFSQVTFIQRVDTTGGVAPAASACGVQTDGATNVDAVVKVPYTAEYYFFEGAADAGP